MSEAKRQAHILITLESAAILFSYFLPRFGNVKLIYLILTGLIIGACVLNFFIFREHKHANSLTILTTLFFALLLFFQSLINKDYSKLILTLSVITIFFVFEGLYLVWGRRVDMVLRLGKEAGIIQVFSLLSIFFLSFNIYALRIIFPVSSLLLIQGFVILAAAVIFLTLNVWLDGFKKTLVESIAGTLLVSEAFLVLFFSPLPVYARSILLISIFYVFLGIIQIKSLPLFNAKVLKNYLTIAILVFIFTVFLARWR